VAVIEGMGLLPRKHARFFVIEQTMAERAKCNAPDSFATQA